MKHLAQHKKNIIERKPETFNAIEEIFGTSLMYHFQTAGLSNENKKSIPLIRVATFVKNSSESQVIHISQWLKMVLIRDLKPVKSMLMYP